MSEPEEVKSDPYGWPAALQRTLPTFTYASGLVLVTLGGLMATAVVASLTYWLLPFDGWGGVQVWATVLYLVALVASVLPWAKVALPGAVAVPLTSGVAFACVLYRHDVVHARGAFPTLLFTIVLLIAAASIGALLPSIYPADGKRNRNQWRYAVLAIACSMIIATTLSRGVGVSVSTYAGIAISFIVYNAIGSANSIRYGKRGMQNLLHSCVAFVLLADAAAYIVFTRY